MSFSESVSEPKSPNFQFLAKHDDVLVRQAALAERYVFDDANSALIKLLLAQHCAASVGIVVDTRDSFLEVLDRLWSSGAINPQGSQLFHGLRKLGNDAAHSYADDRRAALHQLQMARKLAVWFHKSFGNDPNFRAGPFVPPPNPKQAEQALADELERLRKQIVESETTANDLKVTLDTEVRLRAEAEAAAEKAYADLESTFELAVETESQLTEERNRLEERLVQLKASHDAASSETKQAIIKFAQREAAAVDLDETATRHIIDQQLREAGWEADSQQM